MEQRILAVGGDRRQTWLAKLLPGLGPTDTWRVPGLPDSAGPGAYDVVVLPCPCLDRAGRIRAGEEGLSPAELLPRLGPETLVFGGALGALAEELRPVCRRTADLLWDPFVAAENARLTAEAALPLAMEALEGSLRGVSCAVLGFGRIGKCLAALLLAQGAGVTVAARRPEVMAEAAALGYGVRSFRDPADSEAVWFNTVPARALPEGCLPETGLWVELASAPGGLPESRPGGLRVLPAGGLPGKYLPRSAAEVLYRGILRQLR